MRTGSPLRLWYGSAMVMLMTGNLGSAVQPHWLYEDKGLDVHRELQDCGTCMEDVFTDGETSCPVCLQVISDCLTPFEDDPYGAVGICTPCGYLSTSELEDFYENLCGELSDITKYTVENCWSYLVPSCPDDYTTDSSDDYTTDSSDDYTTESSDDYTTESSDDYTTESADDYTTDSSDDYTTDSSDDYYTTEDDFVATTDDVLDSSDDSVGFTTFPTDDDPVEPVEPSSNGGRICVCRTSGGYLAIAVFTVLLSTWTH